MRTCARACACARTVRVRAGARTRARVRAHTRVCVCPIFLKHGNLWVDAVCVCGWVLVWVPMLECPTGDGQEGKAGQQDSKRAGQRVGQQDTKSALGPRYAVSDKDCQRPKPREINKEKLVGNTFLPPGECLLVPY